MRAVFIHKPIMKHLISFMNPLDWMCLARAFPLATRKFPYRETLNNLAFAHILLCLTHYFSGNGDIAQFILDNLGTHYALTGGFLLASMTGDAHFMHGDLDIIHVIHTRTGPVLEDHLVERGWMTDRAPNTVYARNANSNLSCVMDYVVYGKHVQVLHVADCPSYVQGFDLSFCKNYYNPTEGLVVFNLEAIIRKQCRVNLEQSHLGIHVPRKILEKAQVVEARIAKWRARGYNICIEPEMEVDALCALLMRSRAADDGEDFQEIAKECNLLWVNKRS